MKSMKNVHIRFTVTEWLTLSCSFNFAFDPFDTNSARHEWCFVVEKQVILASTNNNFRFWFSCAIVSVVHFALASLHKNIQLFLTLTYICLPYAMAVDVVVAMIVCWTGNAIVRNTSKHCCCRRRRRCSNSKLFCNTDYALFRCLLFWFLSKLSPFGSRSHELSTRFQIGIFETNKHKKKNYQKLELLFSAYVTNKLMYVCGRFKSSAHLDFTLLFRFVAFTFFLFYSFSVGFSLSLSFTLTIFTGIAGYD